MIHIYNVYIYIYRAYMYMIQVDVLWMVAKSCTSWLNGLSRCNPISYIHNYQ